MAGVTVPGDCENGVRDVGETDVDCGGGSGAPCRPGSACAVQRDCEVRTCTSRGVCEFEFCGDGSSNESETGVDCGGSDCERRCPENEACRVDADCVGPLVCDQSRCTPGACDAELGPCGSPACPCANGRDCTDHAECASGNCASGACAVGPIVLTRNDEPNAAVTTTPAILQTVAVRNDAPIALSLGDFTIRYYFSRDGVSEQRALCDESRAPAPSTCEGVEAILTDVSSPFADTVVELELPAVELAPGATCAEIPLSVEAAGGALYEQSNDHSFASNVSLVPNGRATLHRNGLLVSGRAP